MDGESLFPADPVTEDAAASRPAEGTRASAARVLPARRWKSARELCAEELAARATLKLAPAPVSGSPALQTS